MAAISCAEVTSTTTLRPHCPALPDHPVGLYQPPDNTRAPLTIFDRAAFDMHAVVLCVFRPPVPANNLLREGLAKALSYFPHLAGRLATDDRNRPHVLLNGAGIRFVEATFSSTLEEHLPLDLSRGLRHLYPPLDGVLEEIQLVQLNRFACGGLVVGQATSHRVADGQCMSVFWTVWGRLVRGLDVDGLECPPCHDRSAISVPHGPLRCEFDHYQNEFSERMPRPPPSSSSVDHITLHFSADFILKLKSKVMSGGFPAGRRCTTFQCLLTHMWKKLTRVRGLNSEETTRVRVAVNGRSRLRASVPMSYFGNLVLWAYPTMKVKEVLDGSYGAVAAEIEKAVAKVDEAYFRSFINFGELLEREGKGDLAKGAPEERSLCPDVEVDSWLSFNFHEVDFGEGPPCAFVPPLAAVEGLLIFMPSCEKSGGVDVFAGVFHDQADQFSRSSHILD